MILFKSCPRCGGDIDATYQDDAHCIQCGSRPRLEYPGPRVFASSGALPDETTPQRANPVCPKCFTENVSRLQKVRSDYNTCYRCHECGHIYSPRTSTTRRHKNASEM